MIREIGELSVEQIDDERERFSQTVTVILWDVGDFTTPETFVGYRIADDAEVYYVPVSAVSFFVPSMLNPDMNQNELRPLKPQISLTYMPWWVIVGVFTGIGAGGWLLYLRYHHRLANQPSEEVPSLDPIIIIQSTLAKLTLIRLFQLMGLIG